VFLKRTSGIAEHAKSALVGVGWSGAAQSVGKEDEFEDSNKLDPGDGRFAVPKT
jgi:hypothetical protein